MAKTLEARIAQLEARVLELQASSLHHAAAEVALLQMLEDVGNHTGKKTYSHRSFVAAFRHHALDARGRLLEKLNSRDPALARQVAHALKDI